MVKEDFNWNIGNILLDQASRQIDEEVHWSVHIKVSSSTIQGQVQRMNIINRQVVLDMRIANE